ncbi:hypothetical protein PV341_37160 [Streptomyces sp. PA03-1a]|nr:hypothetical protein [Streptomyces sp. PA03-1a]
MPATLAVRPRLDVAVCGSCQGTGEEVDTDGSLTGLPGVVLPCGECGGTPNLHDRPGEHCPCWVPTWDHNDGHTGWVPIPLNYIEDDGPLFTACMRHNTAVRAALFTGPVAVVA